MRERRLWGESVTDVGADVLARFWAAATQSAASGRSGWMRVDVLLIRPASISWTDFSFSVPPQTS